jgi:NAD(P)-dependent dehydrogenase (short-subunit alcohol dehydrogenase family)
MFHREEAGMSQEDQRKIAVVAGGGSGIGQGCALRLASEGHEVILLGRTPEKLEATANRIARMGGRAETFSADVRDWDRLGELGRMLSDKGLDLLINCAGGQFLSPATELSPNGWRSVIDVNLTGSFQLARQLHPALRRRQGGVVNVVADVWQRAAPDMAHSGAARAGVISLTRTLALEWAGDRIRVNAVSPGLTETPAVRKYNLPFDPAGLVPLGRFGTVDEIVDAILFMGRAAYVTGEVLTVDGGYWLR